MASPNLTYFQLALGTLLVCSSGARVLTKDKFGTAGAAMLAFGFMFAALPITQNMQLDIPGMKLKIEALQKQVDETKQQLNVAQQKASDAETQAQASLIAVDQTVKSSRAMTDCMERLWSSGIAKNPETRALVTQSRAAIDSVEKTLAAHKPKAAISPSASRP